MRAVGAEMMTWRLEPEVGTLMWLFFFNQQETLLVRAVHL
jgi:hypothetical protein